MSSSSHREELQEALCRYTRDTLTHISTLKEFCDQMPRWVLDREAELEKMKDINTRAKVKITEDFKKYMKSKMSDRPRQKLEKELAAVLEDTLGGLKKLRPFLDAVEQLSVTSRSVFKEDNQVLKLPEGVNLQNIWVVVMTTRMLCPLLVEFKRDDSQFFLPRLQNVLVLTYQLDKYIRTTKKMFDKMLQKRAVLQVSSLQPVVDLQGLSDADIERMLSHINECHDIRNDQHFRMVSLFQEDACSSFIKEFGDRKPRMMQFLTELEESAVQLERMNFGAKVSSVAGSSVGLVGGVLSIAGLALSPVTAGASLALTMTGVGLGVTSGVNSAVTAATEVGVNRKWKGKADKIFKSFMEDMESLQNCLKTTMDRASDLDVVLVVGKVIGNVGAIGKNIDTLVDLASAFKVLKSEEVLASAGKASSVPKIVSDIPDFGQAAAKAPLVMSKSARAGFITVNALFIGVDIFFICKDSIGLAKGSKSNRSQFIRARAALWRSEVDAWEKMSNSLREGQPSFKKKQDILETDFYLEELQEALYRYTTDTLTHISTLKEFCDQMPRWVLDRETELKKMKDIDIRATEYIKNKMSNRRRQELEKELAAVLKDTLGGLEKLRRFLDAVEQLSVTSLSVFKEDNQVLKLPEGINLRNIWVVVITTRVVSPLLVEFKRDDSEFFLPRLQNVAVLTYQLDKYIRTSEKMFDKMLQRSAVFQVSSLQPVVDLQGLCKVDKERMLSHIDECRDIRNDQHFRMVSLFQEDTCSSFIKEFGDRKPRMMQFLTELEESAEQLERMKFGAKVSSVVGSSVGGLGLNPFTLEASLALTATGVGLGVNSTVTAITDVRVYREWQDKAEEVFKSFMEDVTSLQDCLKTTMDKASDLDVALMVGEVTGNVRVMRKSIDSLVDFASAPTIPTVEVASAGKALAEERKALHSFPKMASHRPGIGPDVVKVTLDTSQFIRARAALWRSEVDAWEKMSNSLREGQPSFKKKQDILETDFYLQGDPPMEKIRE